MSGTLSLGASWEGSSGRVFEKPTDGERNDVVKGRGKRKHLTGKLKEPLRPEFSWLRGSVEFQELVDCPLTNLPACPTEGLIAKISLSASIYGGVGIGGVEIGTAIVWEWENLIFKGFKPEAIWKFKKGVGIRPIVKGEGSGTCNYRLL